MSSFQEIGPRSAAEGTGIPPRSGQIREDRGGLTGGGLTTSVEDEAAEGDKGDAPGPGGAA